MGDALALIRASEEVALSAGQRDAIGLLALVAGQDVEPGEDRRDLADRGAVAPDRVISTVDPEARHMHKSRVVLPRRLQGPPRGRARHRDRSPRAPLTTGERGRRADRGGAAREGVSGPTRCWPTRPTAPAMSGRRSKRRQAPRAHQADPAAPEPSPAGSAIDDFTIDVAAATVTCPHGITVTIARRGSAIFGARCRGCPLRERCTRARRGRSHQACTRTTISLAAARRQGETEGFKAAVPQAPTDGGALDRLARRRWPPQGPFPGRRTQPARSVPPGPSRARADRSPRPRTVPVPRGARPDRTPAARSSGETRPATPALWLGPGPSRRRT